MLRSCRYRPVFRRTGAPAPAVLLVIFSSLAVPRPAVSQVPTPDHVGVTWDFETGDLQGWTPTGSAFQFQPMRGDAPNRAQPGNHQGRYWVGTFGLLQAKQPTGTLTSRSFQIPRGALSFLVGGDSTFETRVELRVHEQIEPDWTFRYASGAGSGPMRRVEWDLTEVQGRMGAIRIVDESSTGYITADDFRFGPAVRPELPQFELLAPTRVFPPPRPRLVPVPVLRDRNVEEASRILEDAELELGTVRYRDSARPIGTVLDQNPRPDSLVIPGSAVSIVVARGVEVPNLREQLLADAERLLGRRLRLGQVARESSAAEPGLVLDQEPRPGSFAPLGTPINVIVAAPVEVPDVVGLDTAVARQILARRGLLFGERSRRVSGQPLGRVVAQRPEPGDSLPLERRVDVAVAAGVPVPPLIGLGAVVARQRVEEGRLIPGTVDSLPSASPTGTVIEQTPNAQELVPLNTQVDIVLAAAVPVPDLASNSENQARRRLEEAGLLLGGVDSIPSARLTGTVLEQTPAAGERVPLETPVNVLLAGAVPVPRVLDIPQVRARQGILGAGLSVGKVGRDTSESEPGTVLTQSPPGGARVPLETPVDLVVAMGVTVPALVGRDRLDARRELDRLRLGVGDITLRPDEEEPGTVIEQDPPAQTEVALGAPVDLVVSRWVAVPELVGRDTASADDIATDSLLDLAVVDRRLSFRPSGTVLEQEPEVGTEVPPGSPLRVVAARHVPPLLVGGVGLLTLLGIGGLLVRGRLRRKPGRRRRELHIGNKPQVHGFPDRAPQMEADRDPRGDLEIRWRAIVDPGEQTIETPGPLIEGECEAPPDGRPAGD